jgi:hypothetical protein
MEEGAMAMGYPLTLIWRGDRVDLCLILGQYERRGGEIWATYASQRELAGTLVTMLGAEIASLEERLEVGLERIGECTDEGLLRKLRAQWGRLIGRHQVMVEHLAAVESVTEREEI